MVNFSTMAILTKSKLNFKKETNSKKKNQVERKEFVMKLKDKVILVTGAGRGIGRSISIRLVHDGAIVMLNDIDLQAVRNVRKEIESFGGKVEDFVADVTKSPEVNAMVRKVLEKYQKIDGLVNNAGGSARDRNALFHESKEEVWDYVINLNLKSVFIVTRTVINHMIERKAGKIVNISSGVGITGQVKMADYSAVKAGVIGFTKALAREVGSYGINVNSVAPGLIFTEGVFSTLSEDFLNSVKKEILLPQLGTPEDVANAVAFLCSEEAKYITGETLIVGGGGFMG
jgi:NAD(P)-dependent dehydrogenase (short-subunit alcohol dehydrogenase family)